MKNLLGVVLAVGLAGAAWGQNLPSSPLAGLANPIDGRAMHEGSWDRSGGNADMRAVKPGETITLFEHEGPGEVKRFWVTIAPRSDREIHAQAILRMYWDGEENPSVECPVGAFFGVGFGEQKDYVSLPLNEMSGGYNCYWPMPFHKSARWTLENRSKKKIDAFYYNIDYRVYDRPMAGDVRHFHAQFRRENPTSAGKNYTILETTGAGHYVGTALFMQGLRPRNISFLEGDEMVYVDGEVKTGKTSFNGTGTEDYFSSGWYFDRGPYSAPYHGCVIKDEKAARISAYRWNVEDAIPFKDAIRVTIEHGTNNECVADYSSVAYYYLAGATPKGPGLPENLLPTAPAEAFKVKGAIEGEELIPSAKVSEGELGYQAMDAFGEGWSGGGQAFWRPKAAGAEMTVAVPVRKAGVYDVAVHFTDAPDYGVVEVWKDGKRLGPEVDLYAEKVGHAPAVALKGVEMQAGGNEFTIKVVGKDEKSRGFYVGVDYFSVKAAGK